MTPLTAYCLGLGDDALVLSHRCGEWVTNAPQLEEDVALANIGLDLLGQARALLSSVGDEDALAYLREPGEFRNVLLVELHNGDFATSMARLLVFATYQELLYERLRDSADETLAGVAGKAVKEVAYHREHAATWVVRLGDGTAESASRMQAGLEPVWPFVAELFADEGLDAGLVARGVAVRGADLRPDWDAALAPVLAEAGLTVPAGVEQVGGGRLGRHTAALDELLTEMQELHRAHPGATW